MVDEVNESGVETPQQQPDPAAKQKNIPFAFALAAGVAGNVAGVAVGQPFDIVKTHMQMHRVPPEAAIRQLWAHGGMKSFYTAAGLKLVDRAIKGGYRTGLMCVDEFLPTDWLSHSSVLSRVAFYSAESMAQSAADATVSTPGDKIKMRMMAQKAAGENKGVFESLRAAISPSQQDAQGKPVDNNLMRGWGATTIKGFGGWMIYNAVWASAKALHETAAPEEEKMSSGYLVGAAAVGASGKVLLTNPIDVIKTYMQMDSPPKGPSGEKLGIWGTGKYIVQHHGVKEFGRAASTRWLHSSLNLAWGLLVKNWFTPGKGPTGPSDTSQGGEQQRVEQTEAATSTTSETGGTNTPSRVQAEVTSKTSWVERVTTEEARHERVISAVM